MNEVGSTLYAKRRRLGLCVMTYCHNKAIRRKSYNEKYCAKCQRKLLKERHPLTYWYDLLRSNVRRRKIRFALTFEEFVRFDKEYNYIELKGRGSGRATIDRKVSDPEIGYTYDNIQIMEHASNSRKVHIDKKLRQMYETGQDPTSEEIEEFKKELNSFGNEIELYSPNKIINEDF